MSQQAVGAADPRWRRPRRRRRRQGCAAGRPSLLRALAGAYGGPYVRLGGLKLLNDGLTFAGAVLLNQLVQTLEAAEAAGSAGGGDGGRSDAAGLLPLPGRLPRPGGAGWGFVLAGALGLSALAKAFVGSHYSYGLSLVTVRLRGGVMGVLFRGALLTRGADAGGEPGTLMSVDAARLANLCVSFHELWSLPLQIAAAMALLFMQVRTAFIAGVLLCVALIPVNRLIAQRIQAASAEMMAAKDRRLALMGELLANMAAVKALGWEDVLGDKVARLRARELSALARRKYLDACCVYFWAATQLLLSGTTFGLMVLLGQPLRPSVVFTCLALFNVLIAPLNALPWVVNGVVEAAVSLARVQAFLLLPQRRAEWAYPAALLPRMRALHVRRAAGADAGADAGARWGWRRRAEPRPTSAPGGGGSSGEGSEQRRKGSIAEAQAISMAAAAASLERGVAAHFCGASFAWARSLPPCLSELNLSLPAACLTAVVGEVGSGKSSLLAALLGELELVAGSARLPHQLRARGGAPPPRVAFVGQAPWLMRGSVRDNVCLGAEFDAELMGEIMHAVGLDQDLASGDLTPVGDGGRGLSGGQRLRVALARALYQPHTDTFLFDDLLASLDSHVAQWVIRHVLFGGLLAGATVVVVTKHPAVIQAAQLVVGLDHGRVAFAGSARGFADWKAQQACGSPLGGAAVAPPLPPTAAGGAWSPLVRHTSPHPRRLRAAQQQAALLAGVRSPRASLDGSPPCQPGSPGGGFGGLAGSPPSSFISEDVAPSELLLASGRGMWACHASASPQLVCISEDGDGPGSLGLSASLEGRLGSISGGGGGGGGGSANGSGGGAARAASGPVDEELQQQLGRQREQQQQQQQDQQEQQQLGQQGQREQQPGKRQGGAPPDAPPPAACGDDAGGGQRAAAEEEEEEERAVGAVAWPVYVAYVRGVGLGMCGAVLLSLVLMQATRNGIDLWVTRSLSHDANAAASAGPLLAASAAGAAVRSAGGGSGVAAAGLQAWPYAAAAWHATECPSAGGGGGSAPQPRPPQPQVPPRPARRMLLGRRGAAAAPRPPAAVRLGWRPAPLDPQMRRFLRGLAVIAGLNTAATLARAFSFAAAGMAAARRTHAALLAAVLGAPLAFFDATGGVGRVLNRFSSDTAIVDDSLPFTLNILLANAVSLAGLLCVLLLGQPLLGLLLLPLAVAYRRLQLFYRASARELRRLEAAALSPLYGLFGEAVAGAATLRAAGVQRAFAKRFLSAMEPYQAACLSSAAAANWLAARLQLLAAALLSAVAALAAAAAASLGAAGGGGSPASWAGGTFRVDLLGLALAYCLPIVQLLSGLLASSAEMEQEMVSVERVVAYLTGITPEAGGLGTAAATPAGGAAARARRPRGGGSGDAGDGCLRAPLLAAGRGGAGGGGRESDSAAAIAFEGVVLRYRPGLPPALRGVSFSVQRGRKLGVCGRTGAGKSSLVAALLRLRPIEAGTIYVQGDDAAALPLRALRARFAVVPQSPVLFSGALRDSLDPAGAASDAELAAALAAVRMWGTLCSIALQKGLLSHSTFLLAKRAAGGAAGPADHLGEALGSPRFPPVPMEPARAVLAMQVGGAAGGLQLSAGQSQLVCLARMLLSGAELVLLDEATASVDPRTAALMHQVLREQLGAGGRAGGARTVLQIAHELGALLDYDSVVVMAAGRVVEAGPPRALAAREGSRFGSLLAQAGHAGAQASAGGAPQPEREQGRA
ncbi:ABCC13 [Scenedesmus sp. PABB004]|nr:ABCC13 [Scenedesmus sp. PABB004]